MTADTVLQPDFTLKPTGAQLLGACPFHADERMFDFTLSVSLEEGRFYCFGCHRSGGLAELGLAYRERTRELGDDEKWPEWALEGADGRIVDACLVEPTALGDDDVRRVQLSRQDAELLVEAADQLRSMWDFLGQLGHVDGLGGSEQRRTFPVQRLAGIAARYAAQGSPG